MSGRPTREGTPPAPRYAPATPTAARPLGRGHAIQDGSRSTGRGRWSAGRCAAGRGRRRPPSGRVAAAAARCTDRPGRDRRPPSMTAVSRTERLTIPSTAMPPQPSATSGHSGTDPGWASARPGRRRWRGCGSSRRRRWRGQPGPSTGYRGGRAAAGPAGRSAGIPGVAAGPVGLPSVVGTRPNSGVLVRPIDPPGGVEPLGDHAVVIGPVAGGARRLHPFGVRITLGERSEVLEQERPPAQRLLRQVTCCGRPAFRTAR
jgi:hypothetical protein